MPAPTTKARVGCLHAHHGNIAYLDEALAPFAAEAAHFVDPALVRRIAVDAAFSDDDARRRVLEQLGWMTASGLDGIVVTCTAYAAALPDGPLDRSIPVLTIDEPFFAEVCRQLAPQAIVFTNPGTVDGTLRRLRAFAARHHQPLDLRVEMIPDAFDLFMADRQAESTARVVARLGDLAASFSFGSVSAAQLSMTTAARTVAAAQGCRIGNPLDALSGALAERLGLISAGED